MTQWVAPPRRVSYAKMGWRPVRRILRWLLQSRRRFSRTGNAGIAGTSANPSNSRKGAPQEEATAIGATHKSVCWFFAVTALRRPAGSALTIGKIQRFPARPLCGWPLLSLSRTAPSGSTRTRPLGLHTRWQPGSASRRSSVGSLNAVDSFCGTGAAPLLRRFKEFRRIG